MTEKERRASLVELHKKAIEAKDFRLAFEVLQYMALLVGSED